MLKLFTYSLALLPLLGHAQQTAPSSASCPQQWFGIQLPPGSKTCRIFGVKKPSTLSFYINSPTQSVAESLKVQLNTEQMTEQGKYLTIHSADKQYRAYIFADGAGTQVNLIYN